MDSDRVSPDYRGTSLVNVTATIAAHFGSETGYPPLCPALDLAGIQRIAVLLCDALGANALRWHLDRGALPGLSRLLGDGDAEMRMCTSVFPSTTAAALSGCIPKLWC